MELLVFLVALFLSPWNNVWVDILACKMEITIPL